MIRTFGPIATSATAVPWFGDVTTAAIPAGQGRQQYILVTVANTAIYQVGDRIILNPQGPTRSILKVNQKVSGTVLQCQSESDYPIPAWPSGTTIALSIACWMLDFQNVGAAIVTLGADNTVTTVPGGSAYRQIPINGTYVVIHSNAQNALDTYGGWMIGVSTMLIVAYVN